MKTRIAIGTKVPYQKVLRGSLWFIHESVHQRYGEGDLPSNRWSSEQRFANTSHRGCVGNCSSRFAKRTTCRQVMNQFLDWMVSSTACAAWALFNFLLIQVWRSCQDKSLGLPQCWRWR